MAPINQINGDSEEYSNLLGSWGATICLMAGMIISLLGIKIWWFKHRLNFEQNTAQNVDARGSQPVFRNTIKDKRQSQQVSDSVVVHGIFRKRNEDELEVFERPKKLPPVRIPERSMSTTALIPPPRTRRGNLTPDIPMSMVEPPTYEVPRSPATEENIVNENIYTEPNDLRSQLSTEEIVEPLYGSIDENQIEQAESANGPKHLFQKVKLPAERKTFEKLSTERRATGFLSPAETQDLETLLVQNSENVNDGSIDSAAQELKFPHESSVEVANEKHMQSGGTELFFKDLESIEVDNDDDDDYNDTTNEQRNANEKIEEINYFQPNGLKNTEFTKPNWHDVPLTDVPEPIYAIAKRISKVQKLAENGNVEKIEIQQVQEHFGQNEMHENIADVDREFQNLVHQEFEKRRHSYQEHEGHFLELNEAAFDSAQSPTGYGKSIDEDWENFQDLRTTTFKEANEVDGRWDITKEASTSIAEESKTYFELNELQAVHEHHSYTSQRNAAYVQSIEELYDELSDVDDDQPELASNIIITHSASPLQKSSILKERLNDFANSGYEAPIRRAHKLKAQQKVTFDVHTEEYYLPETETDSENEENNNSNKYDSYDAEDDYDVDKDKPHGLPPPLPKSAIPTPMQRTTKMQYTTENIQSIAMEPSWSDNTVEGTQEHHAAALLFSTQISLDNAEAKDVFHTDGSWAAIRQRRHQSNEVDEVFLQPMPRGSPRPAHRSPLDEHVQMHPAPRPRLNSTEA